MPGPQEAFLADFAAAFRSTTGRDVNWTGGQFLANTAGLPFDGRLRRAGPPRRGERFELGDLVADIGECRVVIEYDAKEVPLSNLLKYWPYIRGELGARPTKPLVICHFSDWWSYGTRRDLWEWTLARMKADSDKLVEVDGRQFDHWGTVQSRRLQSIDEAIEWISQLTDLRSTQPSTPIS